LPNILLDLLRRFFGVAGGHDNELSRKLAGRLRRLSAEIRFAVTLNRN